jgi:predicted lipoprotein with Yx(FWY)xxD motif
MKRLLIGAAAPMLITALLLAGCGSSSPNSSSSTASPASPSQTSASQGHSSTATTNTSEPVTVTTKHEKFGTVLAAGSKHLTVYLFEADKGGRPSCMSACATAWPPVLGKPQATSQAHASDLSTITRPGGSSQVTYNGHPLYYFVKDKDSGDTYGQGLKAFGAEWYVMSPSGSKVDEDESGSSGS